MNNIDPVIAGEIRSLRQNTERSERTDFVTTYTEKEYLNGKTREERVLILRTRGCSWFYHSGCSMCGFYEDTNPRIGKKEVVAQIEQFMKQYPKGEVLKIFTSGSFFDPVEIDKEIQVPIIEKILTGYDFLIVESRPEYVEKIAPALEKFAGRLQVAMGMESTNSEMLKFSINKNYTFDDFKKAAETLHAKSISVRAYLLLKPPYIKENEAIQDTVKSAREVAQFADFISINPLNVQRGTLVEKMYKEGNYRPPWLWSVREVLLSLKDLNVPVVSLISGSGKKRGPHNGHECDKKFSNGIRKYSETLNFDYLEDLTCECREMWSRFTEVEGKIPTELNEVVFSDF